MRSFSRIRLALAGSITVLLLVAFGVFGGLGYAKSAAHQVTKVVGVAHVSQPAQSARVTAHAAEAKTSSHHEDAEKGRGGHHGDDDDDDADEDQYKPGKGCGDKNHVHRRHDECHGHGGPGH